MTLQQALQLRQQGSFVESNALFVELVAAQPTNAIVQYECAASFDMLGHERAAVPHYERALALGLPDDVQQSAYIGLGSTYRALGDYDKSKAIFEQALALYPQHATLQTFYALTLYNVGAHEQAMAQLVTALLETTNDAQLLRYKRALTFYKEQLDTIWPGE